VTSSFGTSGQNITAPLQLSITVFSSRVRRFAGQRIPYSNSYFERLHPHFLFFHGQRDFQSIPPSSHVNEFPARALFPFPALHGAHGRSLVFMFGG